MTKIDKIVRKKEFICKVNFTHINGESEICGKIFNEKGNLKIHKRIHSGYKPYNCKYCLKKFYSKGNLNDHERRHIIDKPYACII
jgi:uncharacterized Zn-finger protein